MNSCVSIIIPVYNMADCVVRCLSSVQQQTYTDIQVILVDDGSVDNSREVCNEFCQGDPRFRLICAEHGGVSHARNVGLSHADGQYLMFIDGDDEVRSDMVERYWQEATDFGADIVIGGIDILCGEDRKVVMPEQSALAGPKEIARMICTAENGLFGYVPNKLYRTSLLREFNVLFDEKMYCQEDLDFALRVYPLANTIALLNYSGYLYYQSTGKRVIPQADLMKNRVKVYRLACSTGVEEKVLFSYISEIKRSLTSVLLREDSEALMVQMRALDGLEEILAIPTREKMLVRRIVSLFRNKKFSSVLRIGRARNRIRKLYRAVIK